MGRAFSGSIVVHSLRTHWLQDRSGRHLRNGDPQDFLRICESRAPLARMPGTLGALGWRGGASPGDRRSCRERPTTGATTRRPHPEAINLACCCRVRMKGQWPGSQVQRRRGSPDGVSETGQLSRNTLSLRKMSRSTTSMAEVVGEGRATRCRLVRSPKLSQKENHLAYQAFTQLVSYL
jgi:hypothetical protein